jgi:hypothetical protein
MYCVVVTSERDGVEYNHIVLDHRGKPIASRDARLKDYLLTVARECAPASWKDRMKVIQVHNGG